MEKDILKSLKEVSSVEKQELKENLPGEKSSKKENWIVEGEKSDWDGLTWGV